MVGSGKNPIPHFNTERDCGYVVRAALQTSPGKNILGVGSMLSWTEYLKIWCDINKVPFGGFDSIPLEIFEKVIPMPGLGKEMGEMLAFMVRNIGSYDLHLPLSITSYVLSCHLLHLLPVFSHTALIAPFIPKTLFIVSY